MIKSELFKDKGVLIVLPGGSPGSIGLWALGSRGRSLYLEKQQASRIDGSCGVFPGWADFAALLSHLKFVKDHQSKIEEVAAVSDSGFLRIIPGVASHFVKAEIKHFNYDDKDRALEWLVSG